MKSDPPKGTPGNSSGTTPTERLLYAHCQRSYLQLWSYANLFQDQGIGARGEGRELCDVIVVFGDAIILFSDKRCTFPDTGDEALDWSRWHRKAVEASWRQLSGASRWVREHPHRIFQDRKCTRPLPVTLPEPDKLKVYRVCVVTGAAERVRRKCPGSSGSLFLTTVWPDDPAAPLRPLYAVNLVDPAGEIFHVLDEVTLPALLSELDTLPDLIQYLEAKESLIRQRQLIAVAGEEDLIGLFLGIRAGIADVQVPTGDRWMVAEGIYADVLTRPEYHKHKQVTAPSYFWDSILAYQSAATLNGTLLPGSVMTIQENEEILRLLAAQPRLYRRFLGASCLDLYRAAPRDRVTSRTMWGAGGTIFVFRIHPSDGRETLEERRLRQEALQAYCMLTAWRNRDAKKVVGICATGIAPDRDGFDLAAFEVLEWTEEGIAAGQTLAEQLEQTLFDRQPMRVVPLPHPFAWTPSVATSKRNRGGEGRDQRRKRRKDERRRRGR